MIPRFYQREMVDSLFFSWEQYRKVIIRAGCGAGKGFTGALAIKELLPARCLWLGDANELVMKPLREISEIAGVIPALEKSDSRASLDASVVVASTQTLSKKERLERFPRDFFDYIFADEIHRNTASEAEICDYFGNAKVCGFTATPFRSDMADLSKYFDTIAYSMPMADLASPQDGLIGQGFAPPWKILTLPVEIDMAGVKVGRTPEGKEYSAEESAERIEPWYREIAKLYKEHCSGKHGVAFLPLKKSSEQFASICREMGIKAIHVAGDSPDREEILIRAGRGEYDLVTNAGVISTGVDIPVFDCFLNLRPTRSLAWYQQAAGRVGRPLPGVIDDLPERDQADERKARIAASKKPNCVILDLLWQNDMLGMAHPGHIVANNEEEAAAIYDKTKTLKTERDLLETAARVVASREKALREALEKAAASAKRKLTPAEHVGFVLKADYIINYEPRALWEHEPPDADQIKFLESHKIDCENLKTKGLAKKLVDIMTFRDNRKLSYLGQIRLFNRLHIECQNPESLHRYSARMMLDKEFARRGKESKEQKEGRNDFLV